MKKLFALLLLFALTFVLLPISVAAETAEVASGTCGENLTWILDDGGTLTISGTGAMQDWDLIDNDEIPWYALRNSILRVVTQDGVTSIGKSAFSNCVNLTDIVFADTVTTINTWAFWGCRSLKSILISQNVTYIGDYVFVGCVNLQEISVSASNPMFSSPNGILCNKSATELIAWPNGKAEVSIPSSVVKIGNTAFYDCPAITKVVIPENVTTIGRYAFNACDKLESVTIKGNAVFYSSTFENCKNLMSFCAENSEKYHTEDGVLYSRDLTTLIKCPAAKTSVSIPNSVKTIGASAFSDCAKLTEILLPEGVTTIETSAFSACSSLQRIALPPNLTEIESFTFSNCRSLLTITIPSGIDSIGRWAFYGSTALKHVLYTGSQGMWDSITKTDIQLSENAVITCNYTEGMNIHVFDDGKDTNCNICGQFRLVGCVGNSLKIEIKTRDDYDFSLSGIDSSVVTFRYIGQTSIVIGVQGTYYKNYELIFSQPGSYELEFVQQSTGTRHLMIAEIMEHAWVEATCTSAEHCENCGITDGSSLGHKMSNWITTKESTTSAEGEETRTCQRKNCDYFETRTTAKKPAKPYKIANVVSGVHVYWKAVDGAAKYGLWRSETGKDGTYKWMGNPTVPHFTDTKVESGKTYYYKVTAMNSDGIHSDKSEAIGITYVSTPDITTRENVAAGVKLGWNRIEGATGYAIYRKSYSGTDAWVRVGTIEGNATFTWTDTSVKNNNGTAYKYTIRALAGSNMKTLSGCRNAGRTMVRLSSQTLKTATKASATSIKCSWTTSKAVTGYEIRFMVDGKDYKTFTVGNYKTGVKTFTGLKAGQTYTIMVRTYVKVDGMGFYSAWSTAKTVKL